MALSTTKTVTLFIVALTLIVIFIVQQSDLNMNPEVSIPSTEGWFPFSKILFILLASPKKWKKKNIKRN